MKHLLKEQMSEGRRYRNLQQARERHEDIKFLQGFKTAKNSVEFRHTSGNMGQLNSKT
jgi:hypothetical protein